MSFSKHAIERLARSGIDVDPSFTLFSEQEIDINGKRNILRVPETEGYTYLCIGCNDCFYLINTSDITTKVLKLSKISRSTLWELLLNENPAMCFTPIPEGSYTDHECDLWLSKNAH